MPRKLQIATTYSAKNHATVATADCVDFLKSIPDESAQLVLTSPPYNIGKSYERVRSSLRQYLAAQEQIIRESIRILKPGGSICWQVGHCHGSNEQMIPLDLLLYPIFERLGRHFKLYLRNRIIWHFEFGYNAQERFSGRHEVILWFTKGDDYKFNLDRLRTPQKYPGKRGYRGPNKGKLTGNPRGKNPGDVWMFPNVKGRHIEKTIHPCQFPVELADRLIEAFSDKGDLVVDPYMGVGTTIAAAVLRGRRGAGCDIFGKYVQLARRRVKLAYAGKLRFRPRWRPIYKPQADTKLTRVPDEFAFVLPATGPVTRRLRGSIASLPFDNGRVPSASRLIKGNVG